MTSCGVATTRKSTTLPSLCRLPEAIVACALPLFYAGVIATGVAYTLQILGQRQAHPAHAAIILSLETVFAAIGGVWLLGEVLQQRALWGCGLMLLGMLLLQIQLRWLYQAWRRPPLSR